MKSFEGMELPRLLELLYDAALDPSRWQAFLDALSAPFGGANGVLHVYDRKQATVKDVFNFGSDPAFGSSFLAHYCHLNPYPRGAGHMPLRVVMSASDVIGVETIHSTEFYNDWMRPQGIPADHFGVRLSDDGASYATLGVAPHISMLARHRKRYTRQLELLVPHMARALDINRLTANAAASERLTESVLDARNAAVIVLDRKGRIVRFNATADALQRAGALCLDSDRALRLARADEAAALQSALARSLLLRSPGAAGPLRITSPLDGTIYLCWLVPLTPPAANNARPLATIAADGAKLPPALLMMITPMGDAETIPVSTIQAAFRLTVAEARLASSLVAGRSLAEHATDAGLSRNTVRNQLATVFAKTGTSRQSELVALIIRAVGRAFGCHQ